MKLTTLERRWVHSIYEAMYPADSDPRLPIGIRSLDIDGHLDRIAEGWTWMAFWSLRAGIWMVALAPILILGKFKTASSLSSADQVRVLNRLYASNIYEVRQLVVLLKLSAGFLYGSGVEVRKAIAPGERSSEEYGLTQLRLKKKEAVVS
jgi:hypothetical protein